MKNVLIVVGIVLIVGGVASLIAGGFSFRHRKNVVNAGPIQISRTATEAVPIAPVVSVAALLGGGVLCLIGLRSR